MQQSIAIGRLTRWHSFHHESPANQRPTHKNFAPFSKTLSLSFCTFATRNNRCVSVNTSISYSAAHALHRTINNGVCIAFKQLDSHTRPMSLFIRITNSRMNNNDKLSKLQAQVRIGGKGRFSLYINEDMDTKTGMVVLIWIMIFRYSPS